MIIETKVQFLYTMRNQMSNRRVQSYPSFTCFSPSRTISESTGLRFYIHPNRRMKSVIVSHFGNHTLTTSVYVIGNARRHCSRGVTFSVTLQSLLKQKLNGSFIIIEVFLSIYYFIIIIHSYDKRRH